MTSGNGLKATPQFVANNQVFYWNPIGPDKGFVLASGKTVRGNMKSPSWSTDGKMVVFHKTIESRPARMLPAVSLDPNFSLFRTGLFPAWAPQGDRVILAESPGLLVMDVRRESITDIYPSKGLYDSMGKQLGGSAWSPDGSTIAFGTGAAFADHATPAQIAIIKSDGSGFRTDHRRQG